MRTRPIRAILVEDEKSSMETLQLKLENYCPRIEVIDSCMQGKKAIESIKRSNPDVVFLDIHLDGMTGFDVLDALPNKNFELIFITADDKLAIRAIKSRALDYLLKPVKGDELIEAVGKLGEKVDAKYPKTGRVAIPVSSGERYLDVADIMYIESDNTRCKAYLSPGVISSEECIEIPRLLKDMEHYLAPYQFCRPNQSFILNPAHIQEFIKKEGGAILMTDGKLIYVTNTFREKFHQARLNWS